jgi:hypothetical protein
MLTETQFQEREFCQMSTLKQKISGFFKCKRFYCKMKNKPVLPPYYKFPFFPIKKGHQNLMPFKLFPAVPVPVQSAKWLANLSKKEKIAWTRKTIFLY